MSVWDVARFDSDAIIVSDGQRIVRCPVAKGKIVWSKEIKKLLPDYIKDRISMMARTRNYLTCQKNSCVHHKASASGGVGNVCGLRRVEDHIASGAIQTNTGFWLGQQEVSCSKFQHFISRM